MTRERFQQLVVEAVALIPKRFRREMKNLALVVEDEPAPDLLAEMEIEPPDSLYGLYQGVPLTVRSSGALLMPDLITLFQEPLERDFPSRDQLRVQVRRTLLHEIAHFFGISDARLRELNAY